jgi:serine/threonine-protein kinase
VTDGSQPTQAITPGTPGARAAQAASAPDAAARSGKPRIPEVELEEEIGRGGMGVVYRGRQPYLDRLVAVKVLTAGSGPAAMQFLARFRREAKILAGLAHPHIVTCYHAGETAEGDPYIVMELIEGPNLQAWIQKNGPVDVASALEMTRQAALALEHASALGIIHRDVKPENVLLQRWERAADGHPFPFRAKLTDLGLARPNEGGGTKLTSAGTVLGTPATMAPEQLEDSNSVDYRTDIYGLGCVLFHALVGEAAFAETALPKIIKRKMAGEVPDPLKRRPDLDPELATLVRDMMAARKEARPQTHGEIIARCDALLERFGGAAARDPKDTSKRHRKHSGDSGPGIQEQATLVAPKSALKPEEGGSTSIIGGISSLLRRLWPR